MKQLGKYEIVERIGEGGFGTVWKGRDPHLKRMVAIKLCTSDNEELRKRFLREAEIAGGLHHANVTLVHDFGYHDDVPFMVQEFLSGEDLSQIIRRKDAVPQMTKLRWLVDIARGLEYAHSKGVIHRDVKPANVRILEGGVAKVMDFGIAKLAEMNTQGLTRTGTAMGTIGYMAPEQVNGEPVDHRADIFAYGVLAYELLTYVRPFEADTMSRVFYRILNEQPTPLSDLVPLFPADLERVVLHCLAKNQHHRYSSFREVLEHLDRVAAGQPIDAELPGDPTALDNSYARAGEPASATVLTVPGNWQTGARTAPSTSPTVLQQSPGAPNTATAYAAPSPRRLSNAVVIGSIVGVAVLGAAFLLLGNRQSPPGTEPIAIQTAADAAAVRERVRILIEEAEQLIAEERPEAALDVALDAFAADPTSREARGLIERLSESSSAAAEMMARVEAEARPAAPAPAAPATTPLPQPASQPATQATAAPATMTDPSAPATAPATMAPTSAADERPTPTTVAAVPTSPPEAEPLADAIATAAPDDRPMAIPTPVPVDPRASVRALLDQYERAYESLDADAVARLWPSIGSERRNGLAQAFAGYRSLQVELSDCAISVDGDANGATADCRMRQTYELKVGKGAPRESGIRLRLERAGDGWRISDVTGR